jgi:hypothetical protein
MTITPPTITAQKPKAPITSIPKSTLNIPPAIRCVSYCNRAKIMYTNIDTFTTEKKSKLESLIFIEKPDIICLTETLPKFYLYELSNQHLNLEGYNQVSTKMEHRGVSIYTAQHLISRE